MSDTVEIVEITDSSINPLSLELDDVTAALQNATKTKRQLSLSDTELDDERSLKKMCTDIEDPVAPELLITESESVIDDTIMNDSRTEDECDNVLSQPDILEQNISLEKSEDDILEELPTNSFELAECEPEPEQEEEEELGEESNEFRESESEHSSEEDDDEDLIASVMKASGTRRPQFAGQLQKPVDDEPIALDDSDDEAPHKPAKYESDIEHSSDYSVDNNVIDDSDDSVGEIASSHLQRPIKHHLFLSRKIVKRSIQNARSVVKHRAMLAKKAKAEKIGVAQKLKEIQKLAAKPPANLVIEKTPKDSEKLAETNSIPIDTKKTCTESESMEVSVNLEVPPQESPTGNKPVTEPKQKEMPKEVKQNDTESKSQSTAQKTSESEKKDEAIEPIEKVNDKSSGENSNESSRHESSLLTEITNSTKDEIFNRYVLKNTDQSPTLDEFSEELFYCLQMNNQEIEKAKQLWNDKLHVKYKIRELMDTIRRHRAVMEIETFGYKPEAAGNNSHPIISSKSSTSSSEKHYMSTESVSRLIQDVRASMLKRDDKLRVDELTAGSLGGDNSLASQWNSLQANSPQGRQGQIIDVQSIINDFRQKNPQEIPRRGRRMKNSFGSGFYDSQQSQMEDNRNFMSNSASNSHDFTNSTVKSNQSGYPEVSLHPVHIYKNLANASAATGSGAAFSGQRSSLLQSILTKQSTRSSSGFHQNHSLPSTSTLARLLTAPERSFQGTPKQATPPSRQSSTKVHNNGEITITPINHHSNRNKDYAMEDDENSMEPPLVIDEAEEFDAGERSSSKVTLSDLLCQGCKKNKAFFMCAGCSRQWYCSKECQELAWDLHAESCMN